MTNGRSLARIIGASKIRIIMDDTIDRLAKVLWDYNQLHQQPEPADCIFVMGSHDLRVAERGVDLFFQGIAPYILFAGGLGRLTQGVFDKPEADVFADLAKTKGVSESKILTENKSTNTGENIIFTRELLAHKGLDFHYFVLVQKPYMERRAYATFLKLWPDKEVTVTSPQLSFEKYVAGSSVTKDEIINIMVGDTQRIKVYADKGFQIPQEMPAHVWATVEELIRLGYTSHLVEM
jgi:uncharacterized SAM-binding protein YcdF (DUF218 family)